MSEFENAAEAEEARRKAEIPALPDSGQPFGVLPTVIQQLVRRRGVVKRLMNAETDAEKRTTLNTRQLALKILANSMCVQRSGAGRLPFNELALMCSCFATVCQPYPCKIFFK